MLYDSVRHALCVRWAPKASCDTNIRFLSLTALTFLIVLGALALAAAIAFGWGGRDVAKDIIERYYDRQDEEVTSESL